MTPLDIIPWLVGITTALGAYALATAGLACWLLTHAARTADSTDTDLGPDDT